MRVLFLSPSVRPLGARQSLLTLVCHLPKDVEPLVVCPSSGGLQAALAEHSIPHAVVPHGAWRKALGRLKSLTLELPRLRQIVRDFRPDLIHANEFHSVPQALEVAKALWGANHPKRGGKMPIPVVGHVRLGITPRQIETYRLGQCRCIAAVSQACANLFDAFPDVRQRVRVVYNGVDVGKWQGAPVDKASLRAAWGWSGDDLVLTLLGLVSPRKNQLAAVEAVALLRQRGVPARLLLAGDAFKGTLDYGERLRARLEREDVRESVRWLPFQKDVIPLYQAADLNLLISEEEGFGRTIIEAGALGIPSVGARIGGIPELIEEGRTGWLVEDGQEAGALADVLERIWNDRKELPVIGGAAAARVRRDFTVEAHRDALIRVWREALELPPESSQVAR